MNVWVSATKPQRKNLKLGLVAESPALPPLPPTMSGLFRIINTHKRKKDPSWLSTWHETSALHFSMAISSLVMRGSSYPTRAFTLFMEAKG